MRVVNSSEGSSIRNEPTSPRGSESPWTPETWEKWKKAFAEQTAKKEEEAKETTEPKFGRRVFLKKSVKTVAFVATEIVGTVVGSFFGIKLLQEVDEYVHRSKEVDLYLGDWVAVGGHDAKIVLGVPESPVKNRIDEKDGEMKTMAFLAVWGERRANEPTDWGWYPVSDIHKDRTTTAQPAPKK